MGELGLPLSRTTSLLTADHQKLLSFVEFCAHPNFSANCSASSMYMLDMAIRSLSLTFLDIENPAATRFARKVVPALCSTKKPFRLIVGPSDTCVGAAVNKRRTFDSTGQNFVVPSCSCASLSLGQWWLTAYEHTLLWVPSAAWD